MKEQIHSCKICGETFKSERSFHSHLKKHSVSLGVYYTTYFQRKNLLNGKPLPFKNKKDYFSKDFHSRKELIEWCEKESEEVVAPYIIDLLKKRIAEKKWNKAPCHLELTLRFLPTIDIYKKNFSSYTKACQEAGVEPIYNKGLASGFFYTNNEQVEILIDTREQLPLEFESSRELKLDFGDYTLGGSHYNYTYVDRKTEGDFKSTLTQGFERFKRELERARQFNSYLYIVVESTLKEIYENNLNSPRKSNLNFIFHNMISLIQEFSEDCQFLFVGNRKNAELIIPKILLAGNELWKCDLQYYIDRHDFDG